MRVKVTFPEPPRVPVDPAKLALGNDDREASDDRTEPTEPV